ncbi:hypothetical protein HY634_00100 [Candidatus Uhrbacteria bacterium]|nr:hypothetical protein [Candidatus Uhrbacteria bacterium]
MLLRSRWQSIVTFLRPWPAHAAVIAVVYLVIGTTVGSWWILPLDSLRVTASLAFLLFIPGYLVTFIQVRQTYDAIERTTFAFILSIAITSGVVYVLADRFGILPGEAALTPRRLAFVQVAICAILAVLALWRQGWIPWWSACIAVVLPVAAIGARKMGVAVGVRDLAAVVSIAIGIPAVLLFMRLWRTWRSHQPSGRT